MQIFWKFEEPQQSRRTKSYAFQTFQSESKYYFTHTSSKEIWENHLNYQMLLQYRKTENSTTRDLKYVCVYEDNLLI